MRGIPCRLSVTCGFAVGVQPFLVYWYIQFVSTFCYSGRSGRRRYLTPFLAYQGAKSYFSKHVCVYIPINYICEHVGILGSNFDFLFVFFFSLSSQSTLISTKFVTGITIYMCVCVCTHVYVHKHFMCLMGLVGIVGLIRSMSISFQ